MNIEDFFATSLGRRDQQPNKELAGKIVHGSDTAAVQEIIELIKTQPQIDLLADALKVLEIIGETDPKLASPAFAVIWPLLGHKVNKIQWLTMAALSNIAQFHQEAIFKQLGNLLEIMEKGSVVTRDHGFKVLIILYQNKRYRNELVPLLTEQVLSAPDNQLGQYSEKWMAVIEDSEIRLLTEALECRYPELQKGSHQKRIHWVLIKLIKRAYI